MKHEPEQKFLITFNAYQHAILGSDDCDGWQDFRTFRTYSSKKDAEISLFSLKKDRFVKDIRIYEMKEVKSFSGKSPLAARPLCERCSVNEACEQHPCPYAQDIHNDSNSLCGCCEDCYSECAQDI